MPYNLSKSRGFTLIEAVVAIGIFAIVAVGVYSAYSNVLDITIASQFNATALTVMANELEVTRNLKFQDIGVQGGSPSGIIPPEKNINFSGFNFVIKTTVRNIDDPFDGVLGGVPNDIAPADYKLVELELACSNCPRFIPIKATTIVAPANLESSSVNGNLFVNAIDASGQPVAQANVAVVNNSVNPAIVINDITNNAGQLQLVDIATSSLGYQITVTKPGYSTDKTYALGGQSNPNPLKLHATVVEQQVTQISFAIDKVSGINLKTTDQMCKGVPTVGYSLVGGKLIGTDPDVIKNSLSGVTGSGGSSLISNLEWDTYHLNSNDSNYDVGSANSPFDITLNPDEQKNITWVVEPKNPKALLVKVQDQNGQAINDTSVQLTKSGFGETKLSGRRDAIHSNWANLLNTTSKTLNLETDNPEGQVTVKFADGKYATSSEELISSTVDFGTSSTNFYNFKINPTITLPPLSPSLTANPNSVLGNSVVTVNFANISPATVRDWIGIYSPITAGDESFIDRKYTSSCTHTAGSTALSSGYCTFTMPSTSGSYQFRLFANDGYSNLATSNTVTVINPSTPPPGSSPIVNNVTINSQNIKADNSTQYNIIINSSDSAAAGNIFEQYIFVNHDGENVGKYRGFLGWYNGNVWPGIQDYRSCAGGGYAGIHGYGEEYIHLDACSVSSSGTIRTTNFTVRFTPLFTTPVLDNDISGLSGNTIGRSNGGNYINFDTNFNLSLSEPAGVDLIREIRIATNNDNNTWNFVGPDGTANTYYDSSATTLHSSHSGNRYLRYKAFLQTLNSSYTPKLDDIDVEFNSACGLDGQAYFSGLLSGNYTLSAQKNGYQNFNAQVAIGSPWQEYMVTLVP